MPLLNCRHCGSALDAHDAPESELASLRCPVCGAALSLTSSSPSASPSASPSSPQATDAIWESVSGVAPAPAVTDEPHSDALVIRDVEAREEDDSATRAVGPERMASLVAQAQADHQRALGADGGTDTGRFAPRDETTTQTFAAAPVAIGVAPPDAAPSAAPELTPDPRELTRDLPASALPTAAAAAGRGATSGLRTLTVALVAVVMLVVVVIAALVANGALDLLGGSVATPTATAAPTATPLGATFGVPGLYQISYPAGWLIQQRNAAPQSYYALLSAPAGDANVNIEAQQASGAPTPTTLNQQFLNALAQPGATPSIATSSGAVAIGGQVWTPLVADVTLRVASGQSPRYAHVVILSTQRGAEMYTIVYLAPTASASGASHAFSAADATYFQPMLASFAFKN